MPLFVYSTLTNDQKYTMWETSPNGLPTPKAQVLIKGGANLANKQLITPRGVRTMITEQELEVLKQIHDFQVHMKNGFVVVSKEELDPVKVVADGMKQKDDSAPVTPESEVFIQGDKETLKPMEASQKSTPIDKVQA